MFQSKRRTQTSGLEAVSMILCDIGNTSYHFLDGDSDYKQSVESFNPESIKEMVYYICVNPRLKEILKTLDNWVDAAESLNTSNYYETMGIDRIMACEAVPDGIIIDAGSAITVDVMSEGVFEGGFIYPGIRAMRETYKNISSALDYEFNYEVDLNTLPKNSIDSISYGYLKTLYCEVMRHNKKIFLTGGDSGILANIFPNAEIDKTLIFEGIKKIIKD